MSYHFDTTLAMYVREQLPGVNVAILQDREDEVARLMLRWKDRSRILVCARIRIIGRDAELNASIARCKALLGVN